MLQNFPLPSQNFAFSPQAFAPHLNPQLHNLGFPPRK